MGSHDAKPSPGEICTQSNALAKDQSCPAKRQTQRTTTLGEKPENYEGGGRWWRTGAKVRVKGLLWLF